MTVDAVSQMLQTPAMVAIISGLIACLVTLLATRMSDRRTFDHRLRLEKEYEIYVELWDRLHVLRRAVGLVIEPLGRESDLENENKLLGRETDLDNSDPVKAFNRFQAIVRRNEPFMCPKVYKPAREIVRQGRLIINRVKAIDSKQESATRHGAKNPKLASTLDHQADDLMDKNDEAWQQKIEPLFEQVNRAIRNRVKP